MDKIQALNDFWNGFEWKAYDTSSVPDNAPYNHISYEISSDSFNYPVSIIVNIWDRSTSWKSVTLKEMEISDCIGRGGIIITYENGAMWIKKGYPWAQRMYDQIEDIRRIVLHVEIEFLD